MTDIWLYTLGSVGLVSLISLIGVVALSVTAERLAYFLLPLVSFAAGALLGDVFIHILPEIMEGGQGVAAGGAVLGGIFLFFVLERLLRWHHSHSSHDESVHSAAHLTIVGDALHNFLDGVAIAAAFLISPPVGIATTAAVIFHEVPQELSQFAVLLHGGWSARKALFYNFISALTAIAGAVAALLFSQSFAQAPTALLGLSAASFIYVAMADLIPELQKESRAPQFILHLVMMMLGVGTMVALLAFE